MEVDLLHQVSSQIRDCLRGADTDGSQQRPLWSARAAGGNTSLASSARSESRLLERIQKHRLCWQCHAYFCLYASNLLPTAGWIIQLCVEQSRHRDDTNCRGSQLGCLPSMGGLFGLETPHQDPTCSSFADRHSTRLSCDLDVRNMLLSFV